MRLPFPLPYPRSMDQTNLIVHGPPPPAVRAFLAMFVSFIVKEQPPTLRVRASTVPLDRQKLFTISSVILENNENSF
jgi:hypothetical protein